MSERDEAIHLAVHLALVAIGGLSVIRTQEFFGMNQQETNP